jgi:hypothetical protein
MSSQLPDRAMSRAGRWWHDLVFDFRYALRTMRRQVAFTVAVISILAVGIGATTAAFTVIDSVLLRALPYPRPDALVVLTKITATEESRALATADWRDYATRNAQSVTLASYASWPMNLTGGEPQRLRSVIVSGNFFDVIGEQPLLGRVTNVDDDRPSAPAVVVLSHGFWTSRFGRNPTVLGTSMMLNGRPATIVGVMPRDFALPANDVDLWMPMGLPAAVLADRASEWLSVIGRLRPGTSLAVAQAGLSATAESMSREFPQTNRDERVAVRPLLDTVVGDVRRPLWLGGAAVLFVLLAGCANAANLLLARATMRRDEIALRSALGADAGRLARQLLVESGVLAGTGGILGIAATWVFLRAFVVLATGRVPRVESAQLDATAIALSMTASLATALLFGGAAAWLLACAGSSRSVRGDTRAWLSARIEATPRSRGVRAWLLARARAWSIRRDAQASLAGAGSARSERDARAQMRAGAAPPSLRGARWLLARVAALPSVRGGDRAWLFGSPVSRRLGTHYASASHRLGGLLLASQIAFALVLAASALFVARGYAATSRIDPGFDVADVVTMQLTLPRSRYPDSAAHARFVDQVLDAIAAVPGVASAGVVSDLPFVGNQMKFVVRPDDVMDRRRESQLTVRPADPGYFQTLRIPLVAGRSFEAADRSGGAPVAIVNRTAAGLLWGGAASGRRLQIAGESSRREVVGVVGDIKHAGLHAFEGPVVYVPYAQKSFDFVNWMGIVVRGSALSASSVKAAIASVEPNQPVQAVMSMDEYVARERAPYQLGALVVGSLAGAAFVLAITGIYGLTAFIVGRRFRELGVRLALGAAPATVVFLVLRQILAMLVLGGIAGVAGTLASVRVLRAVMPASSAGTDPLVIVAAVTLLGVTALMAALGPALRAARIDPKVALQAE